MQPIGESYKWWNLKKITKDMIKPVMVENIGIERIPPTKYLCRCFG